MKMSVGDFIFEQPIMLAGQIRVYSIVDGSLNRQVNTGCVRMPTKVGGDAYSQDKFVPRWYNKTNVSAYTHMMLV